MLEKPALADEKIAVGLRERYAIAVADIEFLPIGNDARAWVYRLQTDDGQTYFLKVRRGGVDAPALLVPRYLRDRGVEQVVAPLPTNTGQMWAGVDDFSLILYPFIDGRVGMEIGLLDSQWRELGAVLKTIHTMPLAAELLGMLRHETFSPKWSAVVQKLRAHIDDGFDDRYQRELAAFWKSRRLEIDQIVDRAESLGRGLQQQCPAYVLCHADIHTANVLLDANDRLWIVDWDETLLAPRERDLMFVVGDDRTSRAEATWFLQGYGESAIDPVALAYYRYEWVVQEIGDYGERVFLQTDAGAETRRDAVEGFMKLFEPGNVVEAAYRTEATLPPALGGTRTR
jgi:spectinomycin phosphotransferase